MTWCVSFYEERPVGTHQSKKSKSVRASEKVIAFLDALIWSSDKSTAPGLNA
jgi:hypothetical protein